ncbi:hydroxyisourate hydrolase [Novosphingobium taihuense]|uniref:5-hydroxyisourate hydrolase n=1 Tax=Novosphingobium taihuense TaxID=260085 RepID=A0A7W7ABV5_9SPHN|nr:hydroxyisourate hydrolase [Novosphingobium taihuense]MBB4614158.1 hydroxyisourate hydrolase [Novosphingobium taihuense]TWH87008.1 5-hydroxyisourate hydrolase [Novosphingobium taihuense]
MTTLSTHVLDTMHGCPAAGVKLRLEDNSGAVLFLGETNTDGRCPGLIEAVPELASGRYALVFAVADYFRGMGVTLAELPFLDEVRIAFGMADEGHYHVPLLVSPFAYSTYRGS